MTETEYLIIRTRYLDINNQLLANLSYVTEYLTKYLKNFNRVKLIVNDEGC